MGVICELLGHKMGGFAKPDGSPLPTQTNIPIDPTTGKTGKIRVYRKCSRCGELYGMQFWGNPNGDEMGW